MAGGSYTLHTFLIVLWNAAERWGYFFFCSFFLFISQTSQKFVEIHSDI